MKYIISRKKYKQIIKKHFYLPFSFLHWFLCSCNFVIIETSAYDIARDENAMSSLKFIIGSGKSSHRCSITKVVLKIFAIFAGKCLCWSLLKQLY